MNNDTPKSLRVNLPYPRHQSNIKGVFIIIKSDCAGWLHNVSIIILYNNKSYPHSLQNNTDVEYIAQHTRHHHNIKLCLSFVSVDVVYCYIMQQRLPRSDPPSL